jgi:hypothetical protein
MYPIAEAVVPLDTVFSVGFAGIAVAFCAFVWPCGSMSWLLGKIPSCTAYVAIKHLKSRVLYCVYVWASC